MVFVQFLLIRFLESEVLKSEVQPPIPQSPEVGPPEMIMKTGGAISTDYKSKINLERHNLSEFYKYKAVIRLLV